MIKYFEHKYINDLNKITIDIIINHHCHRLLMINDWFVYQLIELMDKKSIQRYFQNYFL